MTMTITKLISLFLLTGTVAVAHAGVCTRVPGSVNCGPGEVDKLSGNGTVTVNGTTVLGSTKVNGLLTAEDGSFFSLNVNGITKLIQCVVNDTVHIKGTLTASSSTFEKTIALRSNKIHLINSKVNANLHFKHSGAIKQVAYLDDFSEVRGDIIFDDGIGEVVLRGQSKVAGQVIGGHIVSYAND